MLMGTCHCGSAQWTLEGDPGVITACNCTLCRRYGALWAYDEDDERGRTTISGATASALAMNAWEPPRRCSNAKVGFATGPIRR